jgi:hypothetical protein
MSEFIFLYRRPPLREQPSPQQIEDRMQRWQAWVERLQKGGHLVNVGQPFGAARRVVRDAQGTVTDGPSGETTDVIGYSVVTAGDFDEAVRLTQGLPALDDGTVEIRPILKM